MDSVPGIGCPPELHVFCIPEAYDFDNGFKQAACEARPFAVPARYVAPMVFFSRKHLGVTGLNEVALEHAIRDSAGLNAFIEVVARRFEAYRARRLHVFAEKTPINVNCAELFCTHFPTGLFIHLVRDGRSVASSLIQRKFSLYEAAIIWIVQVVVGRAAARLPTVLEIRYEDLVAAPFRIARQIAQRVGLDAPEAVIEEQFRNNAYRAHLPRVRAWRTATFTGEVCGGLSYDGRLSAKNVAWLESVELLRAEPDGAEVVVAGFSELLRHYQYAPDARAQAMTPSPERHAAILNEHLHKGRNRARWAGLRLAQVAGVVDPGPAEAPRAPTTG